MSVVSFAVFVIILNFRYATTMAEIPLISDIPKEDNNIVMNELKVSVNSIIGLLNNWNNLYVNQLEPKILSFSVGMSNLDTNIKNLQERAHIWDTFQLHISAWNEQLAATDRKLDILLDGEEKLKNNFETKMSSFNNFDYKLETIIKRLDKIEDKFDDNKHVNGLPKFSEITTLGILSALELIEKKLNKIEENLKEFNSKKHKDELAVKGIGSAKLQEILHDISSKVDVIFDSVSERDVKYRNDEDYVDDQQVDICDENGSDAKLLSLLITRFSQPHKTAHKMLENISSKLIDIENDVTSLKSNGIDQINDNETILDYFAKRINDHQDELKTKIEINLNEQLSYFNKNLNAALQNVQATSNCKTTEELTTPTSVLTPIATTTTKKPRRNPPSQAKSCDDLENEDQSGIYKFDGAENRFLIDRFYVRYCEIRDDGKWTVIQRRGAQNVPEYFNLSWLQYKFGFGNLEGDFWAGNELLHGLTNDYNMILRIELESFDGSKSWAEYKTFIVDSEKNNYKLIIGNYSGNASDSFSSHNNSFFSTYDKKNDFAPECCPCAVSYGGGWWFNSCFEANLNGPYYNYPASDEFRGIIWERWLGNVSLKKTKMMIKSQGKKAKKLDDTKKSFPNFNATDDIPFYEDP